MARRYSGTVTVYLTYRDTTDDYAGTVSLDRGKAWHFEALRLSPHDQMHFAADSSEAYDRAAASALGFASCAGFGPDAPTADFAERLSGACALDDEGEIIVIRKPTWKIGA